MPVLEPHLRGCLASNFLELILMPTEACNFRCVYCYEDFTSKKMPPHVVRGVKRLLDTRARDLDVLMLSWFGGEPLLALDVMEDLLVHAHSLVERCPDVQLYGEVTTNGYLLSRPVFQRLVELGVTEYQISLDGPRECHDRKRVLAGGTGTFDRIWQNLTEMRDCPDDFSVCVRVNVDRENVELIPGFLDEYAAVFGPDQRFRLFMRTVSRLGGRGDCSLPAFGEKDGRKAVEELSRHADRRGLSHETVYGVRRAGPVVCYATRGNSFVVRSDGKLSKCTVALEDPSNQVGWLREDGSLDIDANRMRKWMRGLWSGDPEELACPRRDEAEGGSATRRVAS
jgi:uncharacterized protein